MKLLVNFFLWSFSAGSPHSPLWWICCWSWNLYIPVIFSSLNLIQVDLNCECEEVLDTHKDFLLKTLCQISCSQNWSFPANLLVWNLFRVLANILLEFLHCFWNVTKAWHADLCRMVCLKFLVGSYILITACLSGSVMAAHHSSWWSDVLWVRLIWSWPHLCLLC